MKKEFLPLKEAFKIAFIAIGFLALIMSLSYVYWFVLK